MTRSGGFFIASYLESFTSGSSYEWLAAATHTNAAY